MGCLIAPLALGPVAAAGDGLTYLAHMPAEHADHPPLIVLLHGSGADERDMIGLWSDLPERLVVVSPRAPFPDGGGGFRWYRKGSTGVGDIEVSRKIVDLVIDDVAKRYGIDPGRVFIGGFSQGGVMAYAMAADEPGRFRGVAVLSGTLFPAYRAKLAQASNRASTPVLIAHGTADPRIGFASAEAARDGLARLGVPVTFHAYPGMGHTIGGAETRDLSAWLTSWMAGR